MAEFKVTVSEDLLPVLEALAKIRGLSSIEEVLSTLLADQLAELEESKKDPLIGLMSGPGDLSERNEDVMYGPRSDT
jgi:hypothetical protein